MARDEVRVQVRLDHVANGEAVRASLLEVLLHVAARIDDGGLAPVADQVGRLRETGEVELAEIHRALSPPEPIRR